MFRAVAVVVDPIQSVKGKVVIDAFRLINPNMMVRTTKLWIHSIAVFENSQIIMERIDGGLL